MDLSVCKHLFYCRCFDSTHQLKNVFKKQSQQRYDWRQNLNEIITVKNITEIDSDTESSDDEMNVRNPN